MCADAGLAVTERCYYNVVLKAVVEDLALRLYEQAWRALRRGATTQPPAGGQPGGAAPLGRRRPRYGGGAVVVGRLLSALLELDILLFGRIRTGPFFATLRPSLPRGSTTGARP